MNFSIADKLHKVRERIQKATKAAGRDADAVELLAVSKKKPANMLVEAFVQGQRHFGENYLNEALEKQLAVKQLLESRGDAEASAIIWHFIGPIQSNKTRAIAENFAWVHSVDRIKVAQRLNDQRPQHLPPLLVCIQVNIDAEDSKSGVLLTELDELVEAIGNLPNLVLRGLMCIPKAAQSEASLEQAFGKMRLAQQGIAERCASCDTLSMGMSGDMDSAIACGSTMVRVGTALFGERTQ